MGGIGNAPTPVVKVAPPKGPTRVSSGVMQGAKISGATPVYPPIAKAAHVSGAVVLHAIISKEGTIKNLTVISGPEMLKSAALEAVQSWRYKPYLLNGDPTEVDTQITVNFNFGGG
jgi:protein TonB